MLFFKYKKTTDLFLNNEQLYYYCIYNIFNATLLYQRQSVSKPTGYILYIMIHIIRTYQVIFPTPTAMIGTP